jgi:nitrite reductase/ring-hydroxylating ferredoxin subunit
MTDVQTTTDTELPAAGPACQGAGSTRRVVLLGAGAAGATAILAACGTDSSSTNTAGTDYSNDPAPAGSDAADAGGNGSSGGGSGGSALAATADVPEGGGVIKADYVITQPKSGTFKAFTNVCPHAGCKVDKVDGGQILCPCHGSKFAIDTGARTAGPANKGLEEIDIKVDGDNIVKA